MLTEEELEDFSAAAKKCIEFWEAVGNQIPEWIYVREGRMTAGEVRQDFIHSHAIVLQALGRVGRFVYQTSSGKPDLKLALRKIREIDWSRANVTTWEGRAMIGGRMAKNSQNITLTCNEIKRSIGLPLTPEEQAIERAFTAARQ
ncbi:hypothetical protein D3C77_472850 [compost metagenome]